MKKFLAILLSLILGGTMLAFAACSDGGNTDTPSTGNEQQGDDEGGSQTGGDEGTGGNDPIEDLNATQDTDRAHYDDASTLVVYFSLPETADADDMTTEEANSTVVIDGKVLGNTQYMAYVIQDTAGANIFRIIPEVPYPVDHDTLVDQAREEQREDVRPAIRDSIPAEEFAQYDTVFVGYPNWWGDMPMIMYTFFETYDFSGKTIIPFNTHGGSGFSGTIGTIRELEPNATVDNGLSISRNNIQEAETQIVTWVEGFHLNVPEPPVEESTDVLVVYFSATGNTERVAGYIAETTGGDLFELVPVNPYTSDDLRWTDDDSRVVQEYENPELRDIELVSTTVENWEDYDVVFIGYPIWWYDAAWPVNGFVEDNDFTGKTVYTFCTSSSSGLGNSTQNLAEMAGGSGTWLDGQRFSSGASEATVTSWIESLNIL